LTAAAGTTPDPGAGGVGTDPGTGTDPGGNGPGDGTCGEGGGTCTGGDGTDSGSNGNGPGPGTCGEGDGTCTDASGPVTDEVLNAMNLAIQDEYHAEAVYARVIADFGDAQPFYNIINAEQRHSEAVGRVFTNHDLPVPASEWNLGNVPGFLTLPKACEAAVEAELANIALYDQFLTLDLPQDAHNVFTNIRAASLEKHLPAFQACCLCNQ